MLSRRFRAAVLAAVASLGLSACASYDGYGGYYGSGYYEPAYGSYYGWYEDFYYPGRGVYVFDRSGARHRWTPAQRRYWHARRPQADRPGRRDRPPVRTERPRDGSRWQGERPRRGERRTVREAPRATPPRSTPPRATPPRSSPPSQQSGTRLRFPPQQSAD